MLLLEGRDELLAYWLRPNTRFNNAAFLHAAATAPQLCSCQPSRPAPVSCK